MQIEINNISMRFNLAREKNMSIKETVINVLKGKKTLSDDFYALKNISFGIEKGESVGIVGRNGSGKSTLLKVISGILTPSKGYVKVNGNIAPLIELGAGFDTELTARENVFLNGAVLGYSKEFMQEKFGEIIDFSELWDFVDVPVKNFSSGMQARLGFAIATLIKPDILICDEILGVGDYKFQEKCSTKMNDLMSGGTTLLFVSHSIDQVKSICNKGIFLEKGEMKAFGDISEICDLYMESSQ